MPKPTSSTEQGESKRISFDPDSNGFDEELYGDSRPVRFREGYVNSINPQADNDDDQQHNQNDQNLQFLLRQKKQAASITAPRNIIDEANVAAAAVGSKDPFNKYRPKTIAETENSYLARGRKTRQLSLEENEIPDTIPTYDDDPVQTASTTLPSSAPTNSTNTTKNVSGSKKRRRWDVAADETTTTSITNINTDLTSSSAVLVDDVPPPAAPSPGNVVKKSRWDATIPTAKTTSRSRWDATPVTMSASQSLKGSRWDRTPLTTPTSAVTSLPVGARTGSAILDTPLVHNGINSADPIQAARWQADIEQRNRPLTDEELDELLPSKGYTILTPPESYKPVRNPVRELLMTSAIPQTPLYNVPIESGVTSEAVGVIVDVPDSLQGLSMKPEDYKNFAKVLGKNTKDEEISEEEQIERRIMRLLLRIKNGTSAVRKVAMRQISQKAREFGAGPIFNQILPLLMSSTLEHQERHLYVKVVGRILYKLDDMVRPHVHKILAVIAPMLIDEDYYARVEGREIISNLAKAAGLPTMIATMRPQIDHQDEFVRNTTARAFAVVASALGIPAMLPFLRAVCGSRRSWEARHTGTKIVQQIAILLGVGVLPHLQELVEIIESGLTDEQGKVRLITAHALANLAEASAPYGSESFDMVLLPLWQGISLHRGKTLAAFLRAIGFIIPLMDPEYANHYAQEVNPILIREFKSPDEDMKMVVLKVVVQCVSCEGVEPSYVREKMAPEYFRAFWVRRMAMDRRTFKEVVNATVEIAVKIGGADVIGRLVDDLKDESDAYRRMVLETIENITSKLGLLDVGNELERRLVDGLLFAFQEQTTGNDNGTTLRALSTVVQKLDVRAKPYMERIISLVKWRLNNRNVKVREHAAELISHIAPIMKTCEEDALMGHVGTVLFEYLGEEFPDVLGSILKSMKSIVEVIGIDDMQPPINELLPRLTPILKNRHEKVQENCIILVGKIASKASHFVSPKEWMRICFELLELLKAPRKAIRKSAVATFGYIAKAIGPSNVLTTLLNNLKVQERTQRICTTVAIAIVAETCQPYTVLPSLMNEYRIPELHVQNGILKSLSFLFEYIREMAGDYIYAITPILEDALIDRDLVHRQTACSAVSHLALGVRGMGLEDALTHLLNHVWPNIFETSPHVINAVMSAIMGCTVALGPGPMLMYLLQGLFHPAKKVREVYWRIYNDVYIYAQEGLVPFYPNMTTPDIEISEEDTFETDRYERHELFLQI